MDLSKAFDSLDHQILLKKLEFYGVKNIELKWFSNYLSNRTQFVSMEGFDSDEIGISTGVPQGSILGPLLFLIYVNDLIMSSNRFQYIMFADDTTLLTSFKSHEDENNINNELNKVYIWMCTNKLSLNIDKTKMMIFHYYQKQKIKIRLKKPCIMKNKLFSLDKLFYSHEINGKYPPTPAALSLQ